MKLFRRISSLPARPLLALAAMAGAALAFLGLQLADDVVPSARGSVGLTSVSEWPAYQADLDSFANIVGRDEVARQVEESIGGAISTVATDGVEGTYVLDVIVEAESDAVAVAAVDELIKVGIATQAAQVEGARDKELDVLGGELDAVQSSLADLETTEEEARNEAIRLAAAIDEGDFSFEKEALYREADAIAARATQDRNATEQRLRSLSNQVQDLATGRELPADRLFVVRDAQAEQGGDAIISGPVSILVAALAAAAAAGSWLIARDRLNGPVRSAEQVERVLGLPVVAHIVGVTDVYDGVRLRQTIASIGSKERVQIIADEDVATSTEQLHATLTSAADSAEIDRSGAWIAQDNKPANASLLVIRAGVSSVDSVRRQAQLLDAGKMPLAGIILT